jgi:Flp pilus assembly protein TadG
MNTPDDRRHITRRRRVIGDRGSVAVEVAVIAPALVMLMLLVVFAGHVAQADGEIRRAASEAARAASLRQHPDTAIADATSTAAANLADAGIACVSLTVDVDTTQFAPGGIVTVDVTCVASLSSITLLGVPGQRSFHARSVEVIDVYRSDS